MRLFIVICWRNGLQQKCLHVHASSHNLTKSGFLYKWQVMPLCCKYSFKSGTCHLKKSTCVSVINRRLSVTCSRSVVFSRYAVSSTNKTDHHDITANIVESGIRHHNPIPPINRKLVCLLFGFYNTLIVPPIWKPNKLKCWR